MMPSVNSFSCPKPSNLLVPTETNESSSGSQSIQKLLDRHLLASPSTIQSTLGEKLIKKLTPLTAPSDWKNQAGSIIHTYLTQIKNIKAEHRQKLEVLEEDFKVRSLYEIYTKYHAWLKHFELEAEDDPLFLNLLKTLFSKQGEQIIQQEMQSITQEIAEKQFEWAAVQRDEMLRLLAQAIKEKNANQLDFDCYVLDYKELSSFLSLVEKQFNLQEMPDKRLFLIVRNDVHYTALDCQYKGKEKNCILLDASQDPKHQILEQTLRTLGFKVVIVGESEYDKLQLDQKSCSIFSAGQLSQIAKEDQPFETMTRHPSFNSQTNRLPWIALNPGLIKESQDLQFLKRYFASHDHPLYKDKNFLAYMEKRVDDKRIETEKNIGIERKLEKYTQKVLHKLKYDSIERINHVARTHPFMAISQSLSSGKR